MTAELFEKPFHLGDWLIKPARNEISNARSNRAIQPKMMQVLIYLCQHPNRIVAPDDLIEHCWGNLPMSDNPVHKCIAELRKALGDSSKKPRYIRTVPKKGYSVIARLSLADSGGQVNEPYWLDRSPFPGPQPMDASMHAVYFGRDHALGEIGRRLDRVEAGTPVLITLSGETGVGKTSLIQAGLVPRLRNPYRPFKHAYTDCVSLSLHACTRSAERGEWLQSLRQRCHPPEACNNADPPPSSAAQRILFIDQLEWLYAADDGDALAAELLAQLRTLLRGGQWLVIVAVRTHAATRWLNDCVNAVDDIEHHHHRLEAPDIAQLDRMVHQPALAAGLRFEQRPENKTRLGQHLVQSAHDRQHALTSLQAVLWVLYRDREGHMLTWAAHEAAGGMATAVVSAAEQLRSHLTAEHTQLLQRWLHKLLSLNWRNGEQVKRLDMPVSLCRNGAERALLEQLLDGGLLRDSTHRNAPSVHLAHPVLCTDWPWLVQWIDAHRASLRARDDIAMASTRWLGHDLDRALLYARGRLWQMARRVRDNPDCRLSDDEHRFIQACTQERTRRNRWRLLNGTGLALLLVLMLWGGWRMQVQEKEIRRQSGQLSQLRTLGLEELKNQLKPLGRVDLLAPLGQAVIAQMQQNSAHNLSDTERLQWASTHLLMGEILFEQRDMPQAGEHFQAAAAVLRAFDEAPTRAVLVLQKSMLAHYWLGYLAYLQRQFDAGESHWQAYLHLARELAEMQPDNPDWRLEISYALNNLGTLANSMQQLQQADVYFQQSVAIKQQLLELRPNDAVLIADLADSVSWVGTIEQKQGRLSDALGHFIESREITRQLSGMDPGNAEWRHRLALAWHRVALMQFDLGLLQDSEAAVKRTLELLSALAQADDHNYDLKRQLINAYQLHAQISRAHGQHSQALQAIQIAQQLIEAFRLNLKFNENTALQQIKLMRQQALIMQQQDRSDAAMTVLNDAVRLWHESLSVEQNAQAEALVLVQLARLHLMQLNGDGAETVQPFDEIRAILQLRTDNGARAVNHRWQALRWRLAQLQGDASLAETLRSELMADGYRNPDLLEGLPADETVVINKEEQKQ